MYFFGQAAYVVNPITEVRRIFLFKWSVDYADDGLVGGIFREAADGGGGRALVIHGSVGRQVDNRHGHKVRGALEQRAIFRLG